MQIANRRWHTSDAPFLDIDTTAYKDGTVNIRLTRFDAHGVTPPHPQGYSAEDRARIRETCIAHVIFEDDIPNDDVEIMRMVRALRNASTIMAHCKPRTPRPSFQWTLDKRGLIAR